VVPISFDEEHEFEDEFENDELSEIEEENE
jgi:hypothetical protein